MIRSVRLVDGAREMQLGGVGQAFRDDIIVQKVSKSFPVIRVVAEDRPDDDGTDDETSRHGGCVVAVEAVLRRASGAVLQQLNSFLRPAARPYLCVVDDDWPGERRIRLRVDQFSPGDITPTSHIQRPVQMQWAAPDGVWVDTAATEIAVAASSVTRTGISFPTGMPWTFEATAGTGQVAHTNPGGPAHQRARLYGPCAGPRWTCDTTGETLAFTEALTIPAGDYVEIDTAARTALYLSDPAADRLTYLDYAVSTWWRIPEGDSTLRYHPTSGVDAGAQAQASYQRNYF